MHIQRFLTRNHTAVTLAGLIFLFILFDAHSPANADACANLVARQRLVEQAGSYGARPEVVPLRKQLAALRALGRQRQCSSNRSKGGLFDACGDIAKRQADVQRQIARAEQSGRTAGAGSTSMRSKLAALGCMPGREKAGPRAAGGGRGGVRSTANAMLFCVRLADGYFFPAPNSQFVGSAHAESTQDRCRYICRTPDVKVYLLGSADVETEEMTSLENGAKYRDLPTAFKYRDAADFQACDFQRYHERVSEAQAMSVTPSNTKNKTTALPVARPRDVTSVAAPVHDEPVSATKTGAIVAGENVAPRVRVVVPWILSAP